VNDPTPGFLLLAIFAVIVLAPLAFLPTIVAFNRGHPHRLPIAAVNFFLGGTGVGWAVALAWSLMPIAAGSYGRRPPARQAHTPNPWGASNY
jgi:hypothetical protein